MVGSAASIPAAEAALLSIYLSLRSLIAQYYKSIPFLRSPLQTYLKPVAAAAAPAAAAGEGKQEAVAVLRHTKIGAPAEVAATEMTQAATTSLRLVR